MKKQLERSWVLLVVIAAIVTGCASASQAPTAKPTEPPVEASTATPLVFLGNKNIAPVVYLDGTKPSGVAVDLVQAIAKYIPQPIEIRAMDWTEAQALVARGEADALIQINVTEERKKIYDFTDPFLESHFSIFTRSDAMGITGISNLRGLRVGVESGGLPQQLLGQDPQIPLTIIPNFLEGFKSLNEGTIDAVVVDYRVGSYVLAQNGIRNIKVTGEPIQSSYSAIAVKKGNTKLLNEINNALQIIKADGTYQRILSNWAPTEVVFETQQQITERIYLATIFILFTLLLITVIWILTTRQQSIKRKAAEEKTREQYSTLHGIINSTNALIFSVDRQYRYTSFNLRYAAAMKSLYGAEIEQGHSLLDYITVPKDRETARRNLDRALAGEQIVEESYSGEELLSRQYFQISHSPVKTEEEVIGVAVLTQDMTERKRAEEALRRLNRQLSALSDCNQVLVRATDEQTLLNDVCRIICDQAGYRLAWVGYAEHDQAKTVRPVAWGGFDSVYVENAKLSWADDAERAQGPGGAAIWSGETVYIQDFTTDPRMSPWRESALERGYRSVIGLPLKDENASAFGVLLIYSTAINAFTPDELRLLEELAGDLAFGIGILRDQSEHKRAEKALRESEEKFSAAFQASPDLLAITRANGTILEVNEGYSRVLGYTRDESIGKTTAELDIWGDPADRVTFVTSLKEFGQITDFETTLRRKDGTLITVIDSARTIKLQGEPCIISIVHDITERKRVEQKISQLAAIVESSDDAIIGKTLDGIITSWNKGAEKIYGYTESEVIGKPISILVPTALENEVPQILEKIKAGEYIAHYETVRRRKDGQEIQMSLAISPICDPQDRVVAASTIGRDITERKQAEEALHTASLYARSLIEASLDPLVTISPAGKITDVNRATETATGVLRGQLVGSDFTEYFTEPEKARAGYQQVLAEGFVRDYPLTIRHISGNTTDVLYNATVYKNEEGQVQGVFAAARDITDRKQAEEALRESETGLKEAQRLGRLGSWDWDAKTDTITWSEEYYHIYGFDPTQRPPGYEEHLKAYTPESAARLDAAVKKNMQTGEPYALDLELVRTDAPSRWITARSETKRDQNGQIVGLRGTAQDITDRKRAEEEIRKLNQDLEQRVINRTAQLETANKELEAFAYSVSHDLRAPLRSIDGFSQILVEEYQDKLDEQGKGYLQRVRSSAQRMAQLIDDLLNLSRLSRSEMNIQSVNLSEIAREVAASLRATEPERQVEFVIQEGIQARGDGRLLRIVLENLMGNAWKFTSKRPTARIEFGLQQHKERSAYFVRDNGAGFDMQYASKLFGAFQRLHSVSEFPGTGIGLATVQRIIHRHGGEVWAEGAVEQGATFYFTLP